MEHTCESLVDCGDILTQAILQLDFLAGLTCCAEQVELGERALSGFYYILHGITDNLEQVSDAIENNRQQNKTAAN